MARQEYGPRSGFYQEFATTSVVPGQDGQTGQLVTDYDNMLLWTICTVDAGGGVFIKSDPRKYAAGSRITLLSSGSGGAVGVDGVYSSVGALVVGDVVTKDSTTGQVAPANAATSTKSALGVVVEVLSATSYIVRFVGEVSAITGGGAFTPGAPVYLSAVDRTATQTAPSAAGTVVQILGIAKTADVVTLGIVPVFGGNSLVVTDNGVAGASLGLTIAHATSGTAQAGIGVYLRMQAQNDAGALVTAGAITSFLSPATGGTEVGIVGISPTRAGVPTAGLNVAGEASAVNGVLVTAAAAGLAGPSITPVGGVNVDLRLGGIGSGNVNCITNLNLTAVSPTITADRLNANLSLLSNGNGAIRLDCGAAGGVSMGVTAGSKIGFYATAPIVQQVLATGAVHTVDDVITFLQTIGLCKQA